MDSHSETIQIDYDPSVVAYQELLYVFWEAHNTTSRSNYSRQYLSLIFYHDEEQQRQAIESKANEEARTGRTIVTEIVPYSEFYLAESYHQKYYLKLQYELAEELTAIYPDNQDFINSTAVARVNGYIGGFGDPAILHEELNSLGLSAEGRDRLLDIAGSGLVSVCPVR